MSSLGKLSGVQGRIFEEDDLQLLLELVGRAAAKWKQLGVALGFRKSELDAIEATLSNVAGGPEAYLTELLSRWLDWAPPLTFPTCRALAEALRSKTVKKYRLAYDLEQHFSENDTQDVDTEESPSPLKASATSLPHYGSSVQVRSPAYPLNDTQHTVMVESPPTPKPRIFVYFTPEEFKKRMDEWFLQGYAGGWWDSRGLLVKRYLGLTESVKKALEKKGITARDINDAVLRKNVAEGKAYMESALEQAAAIQRAADIQELLAAVTSHSTFLDYKPLEHLIKTFKLKEVEEELERYKKDLQQFLLLMMEAPPDTDPPPRKKSRVGPDPGGQEGAGHHDMNYS